MTGKLDSVCCLALFLSQMTQHQMEILCDPSMQLSPLAKQISTASMVKQQETDHKFNQLLKNNNCHLCALDNWDKKLNITSVKTDK